MMMMVGGVGRVVLLFITMFVVAAMPPALSFPTTAPAFLWSPYQIGPSHSNIKEIVDYHTISLKDLAKSVLSEGGWSNVLCYGENANDDMDIALVFVGKKLQSSDISSTMQQDPALLEILKLSFTSSDISVAFPYVSTSDDKMLGNSLISGFTESCGHGLGVNRVAYVDTCSVNGTNLKEGFHLLNNFVDSRTSGKKDLIVFCNGGSDKLDNNQAEGEVLLDVINLLKQSGVKYTILYASNPQRAIEYPAHLTFRFLAEDAQSNASAKVTSCDGVCQIKSSLLEGIFVGIVLLIILISGLCCMMGIDTPARFEAPQES